MTNWQPPYDPRRQRPASPPQWQGQDRPPPRQSPSPDPWADSSPGGPQYPYQQQLPPAFPPGYNGQPNQQGYWPPPQPPFQPPRRKSWPRRHKVATGFLSLFGLILIIVIATSAGSGSSPSPTAPAAAGTQTQSAAPAAAKAPAAVAKTVATFSGSGIQNTPPFTVSSTWKLDYSFDCSSFGQSGNFIILEDGTYGAMEVDQLATSKTSSSYAYNDAGQHYIRVDSECSWKLKIVDEGS